jgi:hypothetical protein
LYIAGIAAVALPILFHMIRSTPRGRIPFSTVMFLRPSPPRITRRSRLENWPLLLLRVLALTLLAMAFARPFLREAARIGVEKNRGRQIAILLDTSASMRRGDLWKQTLARAEAVLTQATRDDEISIFTFDRQLTPVLRREEAATLDPAARRKLVSQRLHEITPGWAATDTGDALVSVVETLTAVDGKLDEKQNDRPKEVILISDMQAGSRIESLATFQWPQDVKLTVAQVTPVETTNAGLQLAADVAASPDDAEFIRVRVLNAANSAREQFQLRWVGKSPFFITEKPIEVYVQPGGSRMVRVPLAADLPMPAKLVLSGDDHDFDNTIFVDRPPRKTLNVLYVGNGAADDPGQLRYYLDRAFPDNHLRRVRVIAQKPDAPLILPITSEIGLVVVAESLPDNQLNAFRHYVQEGGTLLLVARSANVCRCFGRLIGKPKLLVREANVEGYAMLSDIDFQHPLFATFDDARFSDFTSIHFWKYRQLNADELDDCKILARFDDGSPAVVASKTGRGTVLLLTSGWHPRDSQLALSTKFVPLLNAVLEMGGGQVDQRRSYNVGDPVPIAQHAPAAPNRPIVRVPGGADIQLASGQHSFTETAMPGIYRIGDSSDKLRFTVALAADESKTAPMPLERLESLGVRLSSAKSPISLATAASSQRQLKAVELENRQKVWRWLILLAIVVLILETWLAGRTANRPAYAGVT